MNEERITATVEVNDRRVTLEGPRSFVEQEVRRLTSAVAEAGPISVPTKPGQQRVPESFTDISEHEFVAMKNPQGHVETVTVLGFYLTEQGQTDFTETDVRRAYIRAGVRPPKVVGQALRDAKNKKGYIEPGSTRGTYRLTHHGDRFVRFDLPADRK